MNPLALLTGFVQMFFYALEAIFEKKALQRMPRLKLQFLEYAVVMPLTVLALFLLKPSFSDFKLALTPAIFWILGTFFYFSTLKLAKAHEYALIAAAYPVLTAFFGIVFLGEKPSTKFWLAFALMLISIFLVTS